jgi:AraC-like DNA-binding protein
MLDPALGSGEYKIFTVGESCAVSICRVEYNADMEFHVSHPPLLYFGLFESPGKDSVCTSNDIFWNTRGILGYAAEQTVYPMRMRHGVPMYSVGVTLTRRNDGDSLCPFPMRTGLADAIARLDGTFIIPQVYTALRQLKSFTPSGPVASLFYEGKVRELLAYLLHWHTHFNTNESEPLTEQDAVRLRELASHLQSHHAAPAPMHELASMVCMSASKLTTLFRRTYGCTITDFIQQARVERAKELLRNSTWKIETIAGEVGYKRHGSFSELFKRSTGMTPQEYRNACLLPCMSGHPDRPKDTLDEGIKWEKNSLTAF